MASSTSYGIPYSVGAISGIVCYYLSDIYHEPETYWCSAYFHLAAHAIANLNNFALYSVT